MKKELNIGGSIIYALMGRQCRAIYKEQEIDDYSKNPLIEALPKIYTMKEVAELLFNLPKLREGDCDKPPEIRLHIVEQIRNFMQPLPLHLKIEFEISLLIRRGYVGRNPLSPFYARQFAVGVKNILDHDLDESGKNLIGNRSTANCYTVMGISGIGKTTAVEKILLMYPQVIVHTNYQRGEYSLGYLKQIVWIKIECPFNSKRKSLCQNFFRVVDQILQQNYFDKFVKSRSTEEELIDDMAHICALHCVGVLVIDEIQRMKPGESGQEMIDFFVELSNKLGIPILYIGTYKAATLFNKLMANGRRAEGNGATFLDPMIKGEEWELFINKLWELQFTKESVVLSEEIKDTFYELTMGITDYIVKLFIKSQQHAIAFGQEKLSSRLIRTVAQNNMKFAQPVIQALRAGDKQAIIKYSDLKADWVDVNEYIKALGDRLDIYGKGELEHKRAMNQVKNHINFDNLVEIAMNLGLNDDEAIRVVSEIMESNIAMDNIVEVRKRVASIALQMQDSEVKDSNTSKGKKSKGKKNIHYSGNDDIRLIMQKALEKDRAIEEALREVGIIKPFNEFIS
ncbi:ATP-binding protein [Bacillus sp. 1P02SD]|uniref:ATP-binding protein n=1 Tax=Bacillus sp. 1P02SD TaxID=3132264 RepID=UPI0039A02064